MRAIKPTLFLIPLLLFGCSKYSRLLKSDDINAKLSAAIDYYNKKDYFHASGLLEDLLPLLSGKQEGEKVMYYYAYCYYGQEDFVNSSYYFKKFYETYPRSTLAEECYYMFSYSLYLDSPKFNLDQTSTYKAIDAILNYVSLFPSSTRIAESNKQLDELREKLIVKDYNSSKLYFKLEYYKAAVISFTNFLDEYPSSVYDEEITFLKTDAQYKLAKESIENRKKERYQLALTYYENFIDKYPGTKRIKQAENIYDNIMAYFKKTELQTKN